MHYYNVRRLRDKLNELIECGMGDRAVSFPIHEYDEGWAGDYILIKDICTNDLAEIAVYLTPHSPVVDEKVWKYLEDKRQMEKGID